MNVVILGGSGFIGRNLSRHLVGLGHTVHSISRSPTRVRWPGISYIDCNFDNTHQLGDIYQKADCIFHLASDTTPSTSNMQPSLEITANLLPSMRLIEYLERYCSPHLVYASSGGTIYGQNSSNAHRESERMSPISYYGAGKAATELLLKAYQHQSGGNVTIIRPSNLYGPGQFPKQQFGVIPTLFECIQHKMPFKLWGKGESIRDYLFIDDFIELCGMILQKPRSENCYTVFNAGTGAGCSLTELIKTIEEITETRLEIEPAPARGIDISKVTLDTERTNLEFGWQPTTPLKVGLKETWNWYINQR